MMSRVQYITFLFALSILCFFTQPMVNAHSANIVAKVDLSQQRMQVYVNGKRKHVWHVSTGKKGWRTPTGRFRPYLMYRNYYEKHWDANLPYLVALTRSGIAIHGTNATHKLGRPASHGCIRLSVGNASRFFGLVRKYGLRNTQVVITQ